MPSNELSGEHSDIAQTISRKHVIVTGAGFTRALVPDAPLLVDDFSNDILKDKVRYMPYASGLLDWERRFNPSGYIDIERFMTRLDVSCRHLGHLLNQCGSPEAKWQNVICSQKKRDPLEGCRASVSYTGVVKSPIVLYFIYGLSFLECRYRIGPRQLPTRWQHKWLP